MKPAEVAGFGAATERKFTQIPNVGCVSESVNNSWIIVVLFLL